MILMDLLESGLTRDLLMFEVEIVVYMHEIYGMGYDIYITDMCL
jgi:hypothetical protein